MRSYPTPVLQEFMTDFGYGEATTLSISTKITNEITESSESIQHEVVDNILNKYFKISEEELTKILAQHYPEKLV